MVNASMTSVRPETVSSMSSTWVAPGEAQLDERLDLPRNHP
jgi:hypothetical protein